MNDLPRNVTRLRTAAFFHLKSAAALVEADSASDEELHQALALIRNAEDKILLFEEQRQQHRDNNPDPEPEMIQ